MNRRGRTRFIVSFLAPAVLFYAALVGLPLIQAGILSLQRWKGVSLDRSWVGFENYVRLAQDPVFPRTLVHGLLLFIVGGGIVLSGALLLAHASRDGARMFSAVYLFPQVVSLVVVAILWTFLLNPSFGLVDAALGSVGVASPESGWLGDPRTALLGVTLAFAWYAMGFYVLLFSAGLRGIPVEVREASEIDGAHGFARFRLVTWQLLWSLRRVAYVHLLVSVLNVFALVFLMTQGGPDRSTEVLLTYVYEQAFRNSRFGDAAALAVAGLFVCLAASGVILRLAGRDPEAGRA